MLPTRDVILAAIHWVFDEQYRGVKLCTGTVVQTAKQKIIQEHPGFLSHMEGVTMEVKIEFVLEREVEQGKLLRTKGQNSSVISKPTPIEQWRSYASVADHKERSAISDQEITQAMNRMRTGGITGQTRLSELRKMVLDKMVNQTVTSALATTPAINDHVCPSCGNDKVSKSEKSCWKCGNSLH